MVEHIGFSYNYNDIFIDRLTMIVQFIPYFIEDNELTATDIAQLFSTYIDRLFGIPKSIVHNRDPRIISLL